MTSKVYGAGSREVGLGRLGTSPLMLMTSLGRRAQLALFKEVRKWEL